ncbi:MAG: HEAT repeat domain-containing protein [Coriobacteriia bacterium]|nr:HEAT repeat domain-containing protein [Coriobacteriia bacterium]
MRNGAGMTDETDRNEARRIALYEAVQRRRVVTHALRYAWRDGTLEVETAALLLLAALVALAVERIPAAGWLRDAEIWVLALVLLGLTSLVEVLAGGFRNHISQGVGGLVGGPAVERRHVASGALSASVCVAIAVASLLWWREAGPGTPLPLGLLGGALGAAGAVLAAARATERLALAGAAVALLGGGWDLLLVAGLAAPESVLPYGLATMSVVPLVSGLLGFHQYRRDVDLNHDGYVREASALLAEGRTAQRAVAAETLGRLGGLEVVEPLLAALADPEEDVRLSAAFALAEMRDLVPARLLGRRLDLRGFEPGERVPDSDAREVEHLATLEWQDMVAATYRTASRSRPELLDGLMAATEPGQPGPVRRTAALVLGETREPRAVAHLVDALTRRPQEMRGEIRSALAWTGRAGAEALAAMAGDSDEVVRREAAEALLRLVAFSRVIYHSRLEQRALDDVAQGSAEAQDPAEEWALISATARAAFEAASSDPDPAVRKAARAALELVA